jgi:hypothetical protein
MSTTGILRAALEKLETFVYDPQPEVMWPGIQSDPPDEDMWLRPGFFPNNDMNIAWGDDSCVDSRGFFQILVYFRPGLGTVEPTTLADALIRFFPKGLQLGPVRVRERAWQKLAVVEDESKLFIPVRIPYLGLT